MQPRNRTSNTWWVKVDNTFMDNNILPSYSLLSSSAVPSTLLPWQSIPPFATSPYSHFIPLPCQFIPPLLISLTLHSPPPLDHAPFPSPFLTQLFYSPPCGRGLLCHKYKSKVDQHFCPLLHHRPGCQVRGPAGCRTQPALHARLTGFGTAAL